MRYLRAFGAFWYDFLIGDRPELFAGSIAVLAIVWIAIKMGLRPTVAGALLAILVLSLAGLSIWSGAVSRRERGLIEVTTKEARRSSSTISPPPSSAERTRTPGSDDSVCRCLSQLAPGRFPLERSGERRHVSEGGSARVGAGVCQCSPLGRSARAALGPHVPRR